MNILIAGASGFVGTALVNHLSPRFNITVLGRTLKKLEATFPKNISKLTWNDLPRHEAKKYDLIINLSGSNIGEKYWRSGVKKELIDSRVQANEQLIDWLIAHEAKPRFFCANAVGIYGAHDQDTTTFDEASPLPTTSEDFLQQIGLLWQQSLSRAIDGGIPVTTLRFGVVLKRGQGMLKKLELPFSLGLGSVLGHGNQTLSWIYYKDLLNAFDFLIADSTITGPMNMTSPHPISQKEFAQQFARALKRPLLLKTPAFVIKILLGEMGEYLLLKGQRVVPSRLNTLGFKFDYPLIENGLEQEFQKR